MRSWRNWQTRKTKDLVGNSMQVQFLSTAPNKRAPLVGAFLFGMIPTTRRELRVEPRTGVSVLPYESKKKEMATLPCTVEELLEKQNIVLDKDDIVEPKLSHKLKNASDKVFSIETFLEIPTRVRLPVPIKSQIFIDCTLSQIWIQRMHLMHFLESLIKGKSLSQGISTTSFS